MTDVQRPQRSGDSSHESRKERIDRELMELLNELRVALPGVQFLFAFLLVVDVLFSLTLAWLTAGALAAVLFWWWIAVPYWQRAHNDQDVADDADVPA